MEFNDYFDFRKALLVINDNQFNKKEAVAYCLMLNNVYISFRGVADKLEMNFQEFKEFIKKLHNVNLLTQNGEELYSEILNKQSWW